MKIYLICPVRMATDETTQFAEKYVAEREQKWGDHIFYPQRDVEQENDPTGINIVTTELEAIRWCDEVHIIWNKDSKGSHFDLGAALALDKPVKLVKSLYPDPEGKSYEKVIRIFEKEFSEIR
jgi:nucleoside 2-deoxyribosyltransferase